MTIYLDMLHFQSSSNYSILVAGIFSLNRLSCLYHASNIDFVCMHHHLLVSSWSSNRYQFFSLHICLFSHFHITLYLFELWDVDWFFRWGCYFPFSCHFSCQLCFAGNPYMPYYVCASLVFPQTALTLFCRISHICEVHDPCVHSTCALFSEKQVTSSYFFWYRKIMNWYLLILW